ncbi:MAG: hypothetical protein K8L97_16015 [Anaerolineae bacterium]|nr:hypothetical protein [Anaerolineae bacterium]
MAKVGLAATQVISFQKIQGSLRALRRLRLRRFRMYLPLQYSLLRTTIRKIYTRVFEVLRRLQDEALF